MRVGTKELKNRLSYYLHRLRTGEPVFVTDRGRVVAELRRAARATNDEQRLLRQMEEEGLLSFSSGRPQDFEPVRGRRGLRLSRLIIEDRD